MMKVEVLRMKMEGMSKGMRERMAEYSRRLEAVAAGDNAGCQSRKKCGNRHSRKASASSQRSWSGGSNASTGNVHDSCALYVHGGNSQIVVAEKNHRQQKVVTFKFTCSLFRYY
jgi:hypothetical protein